MKTKKSSLENVSIRDECGYISKKMKKETNDQGTFQTESPQERFLAFFQRNRNKTNRPIPNEFLYSRTEKRCKMGPQKESS